MKNNIPDFKKISRSSWYKAKEINKLRSRTASTNTDTRIRTPYDDKIDQVHQIIVEDKFTHFLKQLVDYGNTNVFRIFHLNLEMEEEWEKNE